MSHLTSSPTYFKIFFCPISHATLGLDSILPITGKPVNQAICIFIIMKIVFCNLVSIKITIINIIIIKGFQMLFIWAFCAEIFLGDNLKKITSPPNNSLSERQNADQQLEVHIAKILGNITTVLYIEKLGKPEPEFGADGSFTQLKW